MPTKTSHQIFLFGDNSRYARCICMQCLGVVRWCVVIENRLTLSLYKLHFSQRKVLGVSLHLRAQATSGNPCHVLQEVRDTGGHQMKALMREQGRSFWWWHQFYGYNLAYSLELEFDLFLDCRKAPTCNSCHDFIWIPIWVFYYSMEISSSLLWDGSSLMWIPYQSRTQSLIFYRDVFYKRWVYSYMLLLMILRIYCYQIMLWWLETMEEIRKGLREAWRCKGVAKVAKPSWSPNPSRAEIQFGFQEQSAPKSSPRSHTNSVWNVLYMDGNIRGSTFQWNLSHIQIPSESTGNVKTMRRTESVIVLCYHILAPWAMYQVGPKRGTS
jgi:hypothetical protein